MFVQSYLYTVVSDRFDYHADRALSADIELPHSYIDMAYYMEKEDQRRNALADYCAEEEEQTVKTICFQEDARTGQICLRGGLETFGPDNPHLRNLFIKTYASFCLQFLSDQQTRFLYEYDPAVIAQLPAIFDAWRGLHDVRDIRPEIDGIATYLKGKPDALLNNPYMNILYGFKRSVTTAVSAMKDIGEAAMLDDFRTSQIDLTSLSYMIKIEQKHIDI